MRQEKLSGLIHQSAAYPHLDYCRVEIHFREIVDLVRVDMDMRCCMDTDRSIINTHIIARG